MRSMRLRVAAIVLAAVIVLPMAASATNGYFTHGVGLKAKGMAGASIAYPQDALAAGNNPAGMAFLGDRLDAGVDLFRPDRGAEIVGHPQVDGMYVIEGNVLEGEGVLLDCGDTYIRGSGRLVAALGLQGMIVIDTGDAVLVCHKDRAQDVKKMVDLLKREGKDDYL